jgi:hypothetical protein
MYCCLAPSATRAGFIRRHGDGFDRYQDVLASHTCWPECKSKRHRLLPHCTATSAADTYWTSAALLQPQQTLQTHTQVCKGPVGADPCPRHHFLPTLVPPSRQSNKLSIYVAAVYITLSAVNIPLFGEICVAKCSTRHEVYSKQSCTLCSALLLPCKSFSLPACLSLTGFVQHLHRISQHLHRPVTSRQPPSTASYVKMQLPA